ncbi:MAG: hypothetical protein WD598_17050 [Acidimicrobiia bacterium]
MISPTGYARTVDPADVLGHLVIVSLGWAADALEANDWPRAEAWLEAAWRLAHPMQDRHP